MAKREIELQDYAVPPGWLLEEYLDENEWSQREFARRCGRSPKLISELLSGEAPVEPDTALQFEKVLGLPAHVWLNMESSYRLHQAREREIIAFEKENAKAWFDCFPAAEMVKAGILSEFSNLHEGIKELLHFFGSGSVRAWHEKTGRQAAMARHSPTLASSDEAISVWLRLGEQSATTQQCEEYNEREFRAALSEIRLLSRNPDEEFEPRMKYLCNRSGVAFVAVPPLKATKLSGAAWWLKKNKAVIQLSLRGKSDDKFWFTFFHEAAHILLHGKRDTFVDEDKVDGSEQENEADAFARDFLISNEDWNSFVENCNRFSKEAIEVFALEQGIAPGIVLGRLQFEGHVRWNSLLNKSLKRKFEFVERG